MLISRTSSKLLCYGCNHGSNVTYNCICVCPTTIDYFWQFSRNAVTSRPRKTKREVNLSYVSYERTEHSLFPPIFIFHGLLGNKTQWETIGRTIQAITKRKVVTVDLRNHGDSPHINSQKYTEQAKDVLLLLDKLGAQQASLIGHSMGGRTAMCVALMAPHKVTGLEVIDISPISTPPYFRLHLPKMLTVMQNISFKKPKRVSTARADVKLQLTPYVKDDYFMNTILSNVRRKCDGTIGWACNLDILIKHYLYWVSFPKVSTGLAYNGPTLFLGGQLSEFIPPDELNHIRQLFPRAVITYIRKTGHYVQVDDPKSFLEITISFLRDHRYRDPKLSL